MEQGGRITVILHMDHGVQGNIIARLISHIDLADIGGFIPVRSFQLCNHIVLVAVHDKISETAAAEGGLHGGDHVIGGKAEVLYLHTVHGYLEFRLIEFEVDVHIGEGVILTGRIEESRHDLLQLVQVLVLQDELHGQAGLGAGAYGNGLFLDGEDPGIVESGELALKIAGDLILAACPLVGR